MRIKDPPHVFIIKKTSTEDPFMHILILYHLGPIGEDKQVRQNVESLSWPTLICHENYLNQIHK